MDNSERRIVATLLLLLGVSLLAVGIHTNQLNKIVEMLKTIFKAW